MLDPASPSAVIARAAASSRRRTAPERGEVDAGPVALDEERRERVGSARSVHGRHARPGALATEGAITPISRSAGDLSATRARRDQRAELRARVDPELLVHPAQDVADGLRGEERPLGDLAVAQARSRRARRPGAPSRSGRPGRAAGGRRVPAPPGRSRPSPARRATRSRRAPRAASRRRGASPCGGGGGGPSRAGSGRARTASAGRRGATAARSKGDAAASRSPRPRRGARPSGRRSRGPTASARRGRPRPADRTTARARATSPSASAASAWSPASLNRPGWRTPLRAARSAAAREVSVGVRARPRPSARGTRGCGDGRAARTRSPRSAAAPGALVAQRRASSFRPSCAATSASPRSAQDGWISAPSRW